MCPDLGVGAPGRGNNNPSIRASKHKAEILHAETIVDWRVGTWQPILARKNQTANKFRWRTAALFQPNGIGNHHTP
jgi:hypothetical protein